MSDALSAAGAVYVTSDVHLGAVSRDTGRAFLRWLDMAREGASTLLINGDLFDFWFEYRSVVLRGHVRLLGALAETVDSGVTVHLVGGNHDWWGGSFLTEEVGLHFHRGPVVLELAGLRSLVAHGDGLGRGDVGYRMLRLMLRGRITRWAFRWLHPDVGSAVARRVSRTLVREGGPGEAERGRARFLEDWAAAQLHRAADLDLVLLGHSHIPALRQLEPGRWYVNTGDWLHHRSYAVLEPGRPPRLEEWRG